MDDARPGHSTPIDPSESLQLRPSDVEAAERIEQATLSVHSEATGRRASVLTIPLICLGLAILACCILIPAADENRRIAYQREQLRLDLQQLDLQIEVTRDFLRKLADDPTLAERLARRQLNVTREGSKVLEVPESQDRFSASSPYALVNVPSPPPLPAYEPVGGRLGELCRNPRSRLYLLGVGGFSIAVGLLLGATSGRRDPPAA
jgi:cell division protein FtsB